MLLRVYLVVAVLRGVASALLVVVAVAGGIEFVGQLHDIGTGSFTAATALTYVALRIPRTVFETLPAAALIGSLFSLGNLAVHRELIVMRASGVSSWQLFSTVGLAGFALAVLMGLIGESLAPRLGAYASEIRTQALHHDVGVADGQATWLKDGKRILSLRRHAGDLGYGAGVLLFGLGEGQSLDEVARADSADIDANNRWVLANYAETAFTETGVTTREAHETSESYSLNPDLLALSVVREDLLDTPSLQRYIRYLEDNSLDARRYLIAYWTRIANIVSVILMTVLALPFVFGGLRSAGAGARLMVGLVIGLGYYVVGEVLANSAAVFDVDPALLAWGPSAVLAVIAFVAIARVR